MDIIIKRRAVSVPLLPIVAGVLLLVLAGLTMRVARIQANEVGVFVNNLSGEIDIKILPGATVYNGWLTDFYTLDKTEQSYQMAGSRGANDSVNIKTSNGADVTLDVSINYRLIADPVVIAEKVIPECGLGKAERSTGRDGRRGRRELVDAYQVKWIRDYARSVVRYKFGELTPKEFYDTPKRTSKAREAAEELNRLLRPHGIEVRLVVPEEYAFYAELENIIDSKQAAEQEVRTQASLANAALEAQKRDMTTATALRNVAIAKTEGELEREVLKVDAEAEQARKAAEAYAYKTKTLADAGFYKAQNDAKSILALAEAEAEGLAKLAASLTGEGALELVKLKYADALRNAQITGVPYATDPRIQKVQIDGGINK